MSLTNIYILLCENNKYYIGKSKDVIMRYQQHLDGEGSSWTKVHKPLKIIKIIENVSPFDEDKYTKEYMAKYGIDNVRGGSYTQENLESSVYETLQNEIWSAQDKCLLCGKKGHFANECKTSRPHIVTAEPRTFLPKSQGCFRCGRTGHFQKDCYATKTVTGKLL